jgi:peptidoglycan/LPS O-acetylase OafA/YrhL
MDVSHEPRYLSHSTSLVLDLLRLSSALVVLLFHAYLIWLPSTNSYADIPPKLAHMAVILFFVLSGFVIALTTTNNNRGGLQYAQARFSRLYSVVLPALLITAIVQYIIGIVNISALSEYLRGPSFPRYIISALFLNEIWFFSAAPALNQPIWSLGFEFWYYVIFGLWFFRHGNDWKSLILLLLACLVAGPKILLMMPVWLIGYAAYRLPRWQLGNYRWIFIFFAFIILVTSLLTLPPYPFKIGIKPLFFAGQFLTDWCLGLLVGIIFWLLPVLNKPVKPLSFVTQFRKVADLTFSIYLIQSPLLILCKTMFNFHMGDIIQFVEVCIIVTIGTSMIGLILERQRPIWNKLISWSLGIIVNSGVFIKMKKRFW